MEALVALRARMPFPLLGLDSDYGSEFINRRTHLETPVGCDILFLGNNQEQESCAFVN